jgi:hypothetical protein
MTFKFQVKEEQCYLVQDKEARGGGSHDPNTRETRWPQSNPRTTHPTGAINPKSQRKLTRLRGKKDGNQGHSRQIHTDFITTKENKGVAYEESIV